MNRIDEKLKDLQEKKQKALISFITAGDPDITSTIKFVHQLENAGADIIELGIPFSDPVAEGPTIEKASARALKSGTKTDMVFDGVKKIRADTQIPILFMMYINCIYKYGKEKFFRRCQEAGVDGVIVADLPFEEQEEIQDMAASYGICVISLLAPTSKDRIEKIAGDAKGFLYCVSSKGVTGVRTHFDTDFSAFSGAVKHYSKVPAMVGFGISSPDQARAMAAYFDGVIIGSAFVNLIATYGADAGNYIYTYAQSIKTALQSQGD